MKRAGVILHAERDQAVTTARALIETLLSRGVDVWALDGDADRIGLPGINATPAMPEDLVKHLSRSEIRDLVEFLAGLQ